MTPDVQDKPKPGVANRSRGDKVIRFIERFCPVPEGRLVGHPIRLDDFQKKFIFDVYDNPYKTRRGILSMARKNGKTATTAGLALAHVVGPEAVLNGQVVSGALSRDQAALIYHLAEKMALLSPILRDLVKPASSIKRLIGLNTGTEYKALAAEGSTAMGLSPNLVILDEIGQIKGPNHLFVDALTTSQGAHADPLQLAISTQAPTDGDLFSIWIDDALKGVDKQLVCHLYAAEAGCELDDPKGWAAANPGLDTIRSRSDLQSQIMEAMRLPSRENSVRNLLLNQRIERNAPFISPSVWKRNSGTYDRDMFYDGRPVYGGLDLSSRNDLTALTLVTVADDGRILLWVVAWTPADTLPEREKNDRIDYSTWVRMGVLRALTGKSISYQSVALEIGEIVEGMNLIALAYDQWRIDILQNELERLGITLPLEPFGQGFKSMAPAVTEFESYALEGYFRHNDNPILTNAVANAVIEMNSTGERKVTKVKSNGRIDAVVSSLMAVYAMIRGREREVDVSAMIG